MKRREFLAPAGATRRQCDLLRAALLLNAGLSISQVVLHSGLHRSRALAACRYLRQQRISPAALCGLLAACEPAEFAGALENLIQSRRWDRKARRLLARHQKA